MPERRAVVVDQGSANDQMLRVVTRSFCREVLAYGVSHRELVRVSSHVLDFVMKDSAPAPRPSSSPFGDLDVGRIQSEDGHRYRLGELELHPLELEHLPLVRDWVRRDDIRNSMLVEYPTDLDELGQLMESAERAYHVMVQDGQSVGLIGGEEIDRHSRRLEMRKFIGDPAYRGRGIGTRATFMWLHHVFSALRFHKVYIHTHQTNVRNINLNRSLGFELEGVLAQERLLRGQYVDILRMGLLRERWMQLAGGAAGEEG